MKAYATKMYVENKILKNEKCDHSKGRKKMEYSYL